MSTKQEPNNQTIACSEDPLRVVARCLLDYLEIHGKSKQLFSILHFLATETLANLDQGKAPYFNYFAIKQAVTGDGANDPSAWFSRYWKDINGDFKKGFEEGLQAFAADRGLAAYPWVQKLESEGGQGNQAFVSLVALPLPSRTGENQPKYPIPKHDIAYIPVEKLELSWWARLLFDENLIAGGWRKWLLVLTPIAGVTIIALTGVLLLTLLSNSTSPVTARDLVLLIYLGLFAWYAYTRIERFIRLVDDRMIMASVSMIAAKEDGVCLELFRPAGTSADTRKIARMIKYAAQCPICGAQVLLDKGEPDFPRRIVGRCQESPREHVFSFDRATRSGAKLRS